MQRESLTGFLFLSCFAVSVIGCAGDTPSDTDSTVMTTAETESGDGDGDGDGDPGDGDGEPAEFCGDGVVNGGEQCDDGNTSDSDACTTNCITARCGDGIVQEGVEDCDDGNSVNDDACSNRCVAASCGDGIVQESEECDDGNLENTDACLDTCTAASCGDGFVQDGVEECDDGNLEDTDSCVGACVAATCGDGFVQDGVEECDDANQVDDDECGNDCVPHVLIWTEDFIADEANPAACMSYNDFRASIIDSGQTFNQIQLRGTADPIGQTCAGGQADLLCSALGNGTPLTLMCGGRTWRVGVCGSGIEINTNDSLCQCLPSWDVRPCIGPNNPNWGGMNTPICNAPTQSLQIRCSF